MIDLEKRTNVGMTRNGWPRLVERFDWVDNDRLWVTHPVAIIKRDGRESGVNPPLDGLGDIIGWADRRAGQVLVALARRVDRRPELAIYNLNTRRLDDQVVLPAETDELGGDPAKGLSCIVCSEGDRNWVSRWDGANRKWKVLEEWKDGQPHWTPVYGSAPGSEMYVISDLAGGPRGVWRYDLNQEKLTECLFHDDVYDVGALIFDRSKDKLVGIAYYAERERFRWFDAEMAALIDKLEKTIPNTVHYPVQFSDDGNFIIFYSYSDRDPGCYYIYDRRRQRFDEIGVVNRAIDPDKMASSQPVEFAARDGRTLHGYLTLPNGRKPIGLPAVVWVHSDSRRDDWEFDADVQYLANRGFAVLQVNYRGSAGYGREFAMAGDRQWGRLIQDDVTDGVRWLVNSGKVDPKRIAIGGSDMGAFVALAGLAATPDLYCAGIGIAGVYDLQDLYSFRDSVERRLWLKTHIGDRDNPEEWQRLADVSPVHHAEQVRVPVFLAYHDDGRSSQGPSMYRALKNANKDVQRFGPVEAVKRSKIYSELDKFLESRGLKAPAGGSSAKPAP